MQALTRPPSPSLEHGLRTHVAAAPIDHELALRQHGEYCSLLRACGVAVRTLPICPDLPDSVFIEDTAVVLDELAVLTSMGTEARRAELAEIEAELPKYRPVHRVQLPAHLEGGDVLRVGRTLLVGLSQRTDEAGMRALASIVEPFGYRVVPVPVVGCLHLKTGCTALPDGSLLVNPAWVEVKALAGQEPIPVPDSEPWGANTLCVGERVCAAAEHRRTVALLERRGFQVSIVALSEFAKAEGGLTCLSLVFAD